MTERIDEVLLLKRKARALIASCDDYINASVIDKSEYVSKQLAYDAIAVFKQLSSGNVISNLVSDEAGNYFAFNDKPSKNGV